MRRRPGARHRSGGLSSFFSLGTWLIAIGGALLFLLLFSVTTRSRGEQRPLAN